MLRVRGGSDRQDQDHESEQQHGMVRKLMKIGEAGLLRGSVTQILKTTRG